MSKFTNWTNGIYDVARKCEGIGIQTWPLTFWMSALTIRSPYYFWPTHTYIHMLDAWQVSQHLPAHLTHDRCPDVTQGHPPSDCLVCCKDVTLNTFQSLTSVHMGVLMAGECPDAIHMCDKCWKRWLDAVWTTKECLDRYPDVQEVSG